MNNSADKPNHIFGCVIARCEGGFPRSPQLQDCEYWDDEQREWVNFESATVFESSMEKVRFWASDIQEKDSWEEYDLGVVPVDKHGNPNFLERDDPTNIDPDDEPEADEQL